MPYKNSPKQRTNDPKIILNIAGSLIFLAKHMLINGKKLTILAILIIPKTIQIDIPDKKSKYAPNIIIPVNILTLRMLESLLKSLLSTDIKLLQKLQYASIRLEE